MPDLQLTAGLASQATTALPAGSHPVVAHYRGDSLRATSTSPSLTHTVAKQPTATTLSADATSLVYGQTLILTAGVTSPTGGLITGSMRFLDGAAPIESPVPIFLGSASLPIVPSVGLHSYTAEYLGDANSEPSASIPRTVSVAKATTTNTLTASSNPAYVNFPVTFTATVAPQYGGALSGSVTFRSGVSTVVGVAPLVGNQATLTTTFTSFQFASITATYGGDGNLLPSTSPRLLVPVQRVPTTVTLTSSPSPSFVGQAVTFTVTVTSPVGPPPDGQQVRLFGIGATIPILNLVGGSATYVTSSLPAGSRFLTAFYVGNLTFAGGSASVMQSVNRYPTSLSLTSSANPSTFGSSVTFTAVVSSPGGPPPDGQLVTFVIQNVGVATRPLSGGVATVTTTALRAGTSTVRATYGGDAAFLFSSSPVLTQTVNPAPTATTLTSSLNPSTLGARVTFTVAVTSAGGTPSGTVTFRRGTIVIGTAALGAGRATFQTSALPRGTWTITATYNPIPANFGASVGTLVQIVN